MPFTDTHRRSEPVSAGVPGDWGLYLVRVACEVWVVGLPCAWPCAVRAVRLGVLYPGLVASHWAVSAVKFSFPISYLTL